MADEVTAQLTQHLHFYPDLVSADVTCSTELSLRLQHGTLLGQSWQDFAVCLPTGNRSPLADSKMKGMITGLTLDDSLNDLARKFNVTLEASCTTARIMVMVISADCLQAIALQTRHIVDEMNAKGHKIDSIYMSGESKSHSA